MNLFQFLVSFFSRMTIGKVNEYKTRLLKYYNEFNLFFFALFYHGCSLHKSCGYWLVGFKVVLL